MWIDNGRIVISRFRAKFQVWIGTNQGAVKAWAVRRRVTAERWDKHAIARFKARPENPGGSASDGAPAMPDDQAGEEEPSTEEEDEQEKHRYLRLRKKGLREIRILR